MAVTNRGNRIIMTAAADAVTGKLAIQSIVLDHTAAANAVLQDTASVEIARLRVTTSELTKQIKFSPCLIVDGIKASTLSAGQITVYTA
jgi:hypothetical protein